MNYYERWKDSIDRVNQDFNNKLAQLRVKFHDEAKAWPERIKALSEVQVTIVNQQELSKVVDAKYVMQDSYAETSKDNPYIGTLGVGPCLGLVLVDTDKNTTVAHIDAISDAITFVSQRLDRTVKAYLFGGCTETNLAFNVLSLLKDAGVQTIVSTRSGPSCFIYDANKDIFFTSATRSNFSADWAAIDELMQRPLVQHSFTEKNQLTPC